MYMKAQKQHPTLTIAIPAYNEEMSIENILKSVFVQTQNTFFLDSVVVYSDGSTDKTVDIVKKMQTQHCLLELKEGDIRLGKMFRLNQIYRECKSDLLLILDADIGIVGIDFVDTMVSTSLFDQKAQMFSAHQIPLRINSVAGILMYASATLWDFVRLSTPNKDHVQAFYGAATLYRKSFAHTLHIPQGCSEERVYLYLMAKKIDGFRYVDEAKITYWTPNTWEDFNKHMNRSFGSGEETLEELFGDLVKTVHIIPKKYKMIGLAKSMARHPFLTPIAIIFGFLSNRITLKRKKMKSPLWEMNMSTKRIMPCPTNFSKKIILSSYDDIQNPTYAGGGAIAVHEVAKYLAHSFEVTVLTGSYKGSQNVTIDGVKYKRAGCVFLGQKLGQLLFHFLLPFYLLTQRYDVWIESFTPPFSTSFTQLFTTKPVIALVHMLSAEDMVRKYHLPFNVIENFGLRCYKHFIVLTQDSADRIRQHNQLASISVIGNGVHLPPVINEEVKRETLSFIGRIEVNQKGLDNLIEAYAKLVKEISLPLVIGGTGSPEEIKKLKALVCSHNLQDKVSFIGRVEGKQKDDLLKRTLIGVVPSRYETFSHVALEMMAYQVPVVAFDIRGLKWIPNNLIRRVTPFDVETYAREIIELYYNPDQRKQLSERGYELAKKYSWQSVAESYDSVIREVLYRRV